RPARDGSRSNHRSRQSIAARPRRRRRRARTPARTRESRSRRAAARSRAPRRLALPPPQAPSRPRAGGHGAPYAPEGLPRHLLGHVTAGPTVSESVVADTAAPGTRASRLAAGGDRRDDAPLPGEQRTIATGNRGDVQCELTTRRAHVVP